MISRKHSPHTTVTELPGGISLASDAVVEASVQSLRILRDKFGFDELRSGQAETIAAIQQGKKDAIFVSPTGSGKSLTYQIPGYLRYKEDQRLTIVITPLRALMRDQVRKLDIAGIPAVALTHDQDPKERKNDETRILNNEVAFAYVSPERFIGSRFQALLTEARGRRPLDRGDLVVLEECHLPSEWGADFRYAYGPKLGEVIEENGSPQLFACSATLTPEAYQDLIDLIPWQGEIFEQREALDRSNLHYSVFPFDNDLEKDEELVTQIGIGGSRRTSRHPAHAPGQTLIYCLTRKDTERTAALLSQYGHKAAAYHAGLESDQRIAIENKFRCEELQTVVATSAYGMGIDNGNISRVILKDTPFSIADLLQKGGRAGRRGQKSSIELWHSPLDPIRLLRFNRQCNPTHGWLVNQYKAICGNSEIGVRRFIDFTKYFDRDSHTSYVVTLRQAAFCHYIARGLIDIDGWYITPLVEPDEAYRFLPSEAELQAKIDRGVQGIDEVCYFAGLNPASGPSYRELITDYFTSRNIVNREPENYISPLPPVEQKIAISALSKVNKKDWAILDLVEELDQEQVRTGGRGKRVLREHELYSLVEHSCWRGYLRYHTRNAVSYVSLTQTGIEALRKENLNHDSLGSSSSYKDLVARIGHFAEIENLQKAIGSWHSKNAGAVLDLSVEDPKRKWLQALQRFSRVKFKVCDKQVLGRELVKAFHNLRNVTQVKPRHTRDFLSYLFTDPLIQLADEKRL